MTAWALAGSSLARLNNAVLEKLSFSNVYLVDFHVFQIPDRCFLLWVLALVAHILEHFELVCKIMQCMMQNYHAACFALHGYAESIFQEHSSIRAISHGDIKDPIS